MLFYPRRAAKGREGHAVEFFTTKGYEDTRSHAADSLPQRATKIHEAMRRTLFHEGLRRSTKPCGKIFNGNAWGAAASQPRAQRFHTIFSAKGREAMRQTPSAARLRVTSCIFVVKNSRKASCYSVHLRGKKPAAWLRVTSCIFVVKTPPHGFVLLRASSW